MYDMDILDEDRSRLMVVDGKCPSCGGELERTGEDDFTCTDCGDEF